MLTGNRRLTFLILILGLGVRLLLPFVLTVNPAKGDGSLYVVHAENLRHHGIYSSQQLPHPQPTYDHMPGMPFYLRAIFFFTGHTSRWAILPNFLLGWGMLVLLGMILKELGIAERVRLIAMGLYAVLPILDYYALQFYPEIPAAFLTLAAFYFLLRFLRSPGWQWSLLTGLFLTLAVFFRPELILNFAVVGLGLLLAKLPVKQVFLYGGGMALILIVFLTPWTLRNHRVGGEWVILARNQTPGTMGTVNDQSADHLSRRGCSEGLYQWLNTWHTTEKEVKMAAWDFMHADLEALPDRAFANAAEKSQLKVLQQQPDYTCGVDAQMMAIARERRDANRLNYYLVLPLKRCFHLLFRTERFDSMQGQTANWMWLGYALTSNLVMALGLLGAVLIRNRPTILGLVVAAMGIRLAFFAWFYHVEYRYMLLYFPLFFILAVYFCRKPALLNWGQRPKH